jgi:hypothetical protein
VKAPLVEQLEWKVEAGLMDATTFIETVKRLTYSELLKCEDIQNGTIRESSQADYRLLQAFD